MDATMMQGQGGQMVECPCCGGSGKCDPETAEKCMEAMQPEPGEGQENEGGGELAQAMARPMPMPMRR